MHELAFHRFEMPVRRTAALAAAAVLVAACGSASTSAGPTVAANPTTAGGAGTSGGTGAPVNVTEADFKIQPSTTTAAPGPVTFHITNSGSQVHEFVVVKTDTAGDKLPMATDAPEVQEDASGLTVVDEAEDIAAGASADLNVTLEAGHYVLICNIPGHYTLGMHSDFTVGP
jgi:uncharacterized cupredoxin-like copper-binding protein